MLILRSLYSKPMTEVATEMPLWRSISIKSEVACFLILLDLTAPAVWMAPPKRRSFSVRVVLPASGWDIMPKVLRLLISSVNFIGYDLLKGRKNKKKKDVHHMANILQL